MERQTADRDGHWELPFTERQQAIFRHRLDEPELVQLEALLAIDGNEASARSPGSHRPARDWTETGARARYQKTRTR
ncbi:hypothetical protein [Streptomyces celluloflavus]|uniref:Transposase n=1 Tax=Streptomyces celluloflavus TaxID=58344 RepID=A0ABW7RR31_9ACTN